MKEYYAAPFIHPWQSADATINLLGKKIEGVPVTGGKSVGFLPVYDTLLAFGQDFPNVEPIRGSRLTPQSTYSARLSECRTHRDKGEHEMRKCPTCHNEYERTDGVSYWAVKKASNRVLISLSHREATELLLLAERERERERESHKRARGVSSVRGKAIMRLARAIRNHNPKEK